MTGSGRLRLRRHRYTLQAAWGRAPLVQAWRRRDRGRSAPGTDPNPGPGAGDREPRHPRPSAPSGSAEMKRIPGQPT